MVDPYAIVRRITGHELISPNDSRRLIEAVDGLIDEIAGKDARIAELAAENERLKRRSEHYEKLSGERHLEIRRLKAEALASTGAVKAPSDEIDEVIASLEYWAERLADIRQPQGQTALIYAASILSALEPHPRATNTVVSHETANVSDKPEGQQEPVANHWPEAHEVADILSENKGFWRACSGCHETNEGHPTGPRSMVLGCNLGHGCHECGGIGAIWDTTDYTDMGDYLAQEFTRPSEQAVTEAMVEAASREYMRIFDKHLLSKHARLILTAAQEAGG